jgi:hypothetical protein
LKKGKRLKGLQWSPLFELVTFLALLTPFTHNKLF